ncbi:MAG: DUF2087 domain-containing protein [Actinobacteria bacterium]|nr:DUF2087 domain-containing protein [Actinomycetota bacterium]
MIAALANDDARELVARLVIDEGVTDYLDGLSPSRRRHILAMLRTAGMLGDAEEGGSGAPRLNVAVFRELLAQRPARRREGVERFMRNGRILNYPSHAGERAELLRWIAEQAFSYGEVLSEAEVNERLRPFADEIAVLRRYLVDFSIIERAADGTEYALIRAEPRA